MVLLAVRLSKSLGFFLQRASNQPYVKKTSKKKSKFSVGPSAYFAADDLKKSGFGLTDCGLRLDLNLKNSDLPISGFDTLSL
jgi:hypothetical protein